MDSLVIFSPQGMLGYGYPLNSFERGISFNPDFIGVDAGSTDAGPYRLGSGKPTVSREAVKRDLAPMIRAAKSKKIPLIIGSAGGAGARSHVEWVRSIIRDIVKEDKLSLKMAIIYSDVDKLWLKKKLSEGLIRPLGPVSELTEDEIESAENIVAVMGIAPYFKAFDCNPDVILCGRSNDPAIFASYAVYKGFDYALSFHLGKILECGAIASVPGTASDGMVGILYKDRFVVEPSNIKRRCTRLSVAAHSLYEKSHPYLIPFPEGVLNLKNAVFSEIDERRVEVRGSHFEFSDEVWIKLEGAKFYGYRSVAFCAVRDPIMLSQKGEWTRACIEAARDYFEDDSLQIDFKFYGLQEEVVIIDVLSLEKERAKAVCSWVRSYLMHYHYKGRKSTSGNLALPFSPSEIDMGKVYVFNIHHLVRLEEGEDIFPLEIEVYS